MEYMIQRLEGETFLRLGVRDVRFPLRDTGNFEEFIKVIKRNHLDPKDFKVALEQLWQVGNWKKFVQLLIYLKAYFDRELEETIGWIDIFPMDDGQQPIFIAWLPQVDFQSTVEAVKKEFAQEKVGPDYEAQAMFFGILKLISIRHPEAPDLLASFLKRNWGYKVSTLDGFYHKVEEAVEEVLRTYVLPSNLEHFLRAWLYRRYKLRCDLKTFSDILPRPLFGSVLGAAAILTGIFIESASRIDNFFFWKVVASHYYFSWISLVLALLMSLIASYLEIRPRIPRSDPKFQRSWRALVVSLFIMFISGFVTVLLIVVLSFIGCGNIWNLHLIPFFWGLILAGGIISQLIWEDKAFVEQLQTP
jgi:hypothetical protein